MAKPQRRFHKPFVHGTTIRPKPVSIDGHRFPSKAEARRYGELRLKEMAGHIRNLKVHPRLPFVVNGVKIGRGWMQLDFSYEEHVDGAWRLFYEDVKGAADTRVAKLRRDIAAAQHSVTIKVVHMR